MLGYGQRLSGSTSLIWKGMLGMRYWKQGAGTGVLGLGCWEWGVENGVLGTGFLEWGAGTRLLWMECWDWALGLRNALVTACYLIFKFLRLPSSAPQRGHPLRNAIMS